MSEPAPQPRRTAHVFFKQVRLNRHSALFSLELRPEIHSIVVPDPSTADHLVRCAVGIAFPHRGKITIGREEPGNQPDLRARIGSLLREEPQLPHLGTVEDYLAHVLRIRRGQGVAAPADAREVPFLTPLLPSPVSELSLSQRRRIALGLALAIEEPALLILNDPLRGLDERAADSTVTTLRERAEAGSVVACLTSTPGLARKLASKVHYLDKPSHLGEGQARYLVRTERVREVASRLAADDAVFSTRIRHGKDLLVDARSEEDAAAAITAAICACQVEVFEVRRVLGAEEGSSRA